MAPSAPDVPAVLSYLRGLQDSICNAIEQTDGAARFRRDQWQRAEGGGGESRVLRDGAVFEQAGVNFSHVMGAKLPRERDGAAARARGRAVARGWRLARSSSAQPVRADDARQRALLLRDSSRTRSPGGSAAASISRRSIRSTKMSCTGTAPRSRRARRSATTYTSATRSGAIATSSSSIATRRAASAGCSSTI